MSILLITELRCDKCPASYSGSKKDQGSNKPIARQMRKEAKADGWKLGKSKDFCPSCRKDIESAIKEAALGNL